MGNRTSAFNNGDKLIQKYYFIDADDSSKLSAAFNNYGKYRPENHQALFGSITSGVSPAGESNWIIIGFDSFKDALGQNDYRKNNKNAIFIDIGCGMSGLAGTVETDRPYFGSWINYRIKNYDYSKIDPTNFNINRDNVKIL